MSFNQVLFRDLILETKDGDWGKDEEKAGFVPYRVIRGGDFPHVEIGDISKVPRCYLKESTVARRTLKAGDLLIETAGGTKNKPTGRVVYISQELLDKFDLSVTCASFARFIRIDEEKVNPKFIFWYLRNMYEKGEMWQHQVQHTGVARFQWTKFADGFMLDLPTRVRQNEAVKVLDSLYEKIIANLGINQTLESMAQTIFKSWFVNFDPVKAKIAALESGKDAEGVTRAAMRAISGKTDDELDKMEGKQPEEYAQLKSTAELFPSAMQDSELGEVPEGWEVKPLPDTIDFLEGPGIRNWQYTEEEDGVKFINIRCIENGDLKLNTANKLTKEEALGKYKHFQLEVDDIVISTSGTLGRYAFVREAHLPLSLNTSVIRLKPKAGVCTLHFLRGYTDTQLQLELEMRASGSAQRNFGPMHLKQIEMLVPNFHILDVHSAFSEPFFRLRQKNLNEIDSLSALCDTLLPKLLSGELSVDALKITNNQEAQ